MILDDPEYGPKPLNSYSMKDELPLEDKEVESPKDIASVSKFIKEFHVSTVLFHLSN